ncbi:argininosuccinate synthase, partial [Streptococcus suis]
AMVLLAAHKEIEDLTLVREVSHFKPILENELSNLIYNALWFSPATKAIIAYVKETQKVVNGTTKVKLYKGSAQVVARHSS